MKVFNIDGTEYTIEDCTAICTADGGDESKRQEALRISYKQSNERFEQVVFGYNMPETVEAFHDMCEDYAAWESIT